MDDSRLETMVRDALDARGSAVTATATEEDLAVLRERLHVATRRRRLITSAAAAAAVVAVLTSAAVVRIGLDRAEAPPSGPATSPTAPATTATVAPDRFVAVDDRGRIVLADPDTGATTRTISDGGPGLPPQDPVLSSDAEEVFVIDPQSRQVLEITVSDGTERVLAEPGDRVDALALSDDASTLAFVAGGTLHVVDLVDRTERELPGLGGAAVHTDGLALSPDGSRVSVAGADRRGIHLWLLDLATAESLADADAVADPAGVLGRPMWTDAGLFAVRTSGTSSDTMVNELVEVEPDTARVTRTVTEITNRLDAITMRADAAGALVLLDGESGMVRFSTDRPSSQEPLPEADDLNQPAL